MWVKYKDGNGLNNTRDNLEIIKTHPKRKSIYSRPHNPDRKSKYIGVRWNVIRSLWDVFVPQSGGAGEFRLTGRYKEEDAAREYDRYIIINLVNIGIDSITNFPRDNYPEYTDGKTTLKCVRCKERRPIYMFYQQAGKDYRMKVCMDCRKTYSRSQISVRKNRLREKINELKDVPCSDCGHRYPPYIMQFHHLDPSQKKSLISQCSSVKVLIEEASKCIVLCSNCHLEREWGENGLSTTRVSSGQSLIDK